MIEDPTVLARRTERILRLMDAARELAANASLLPTLAASSGLSPEGVRYAFEYSLESRATLDLDRVFYSAEESERVAVILSANVFLAPLRALVLGLAASDDVVAIPSSREPHFTEALVRAAAIPELTFNPHIEVASLRTGCIHVYGRDRTIHEITQEANVPVRGHGTGFGVARVDVGEDPVSFAARLARDVTLFDQRGCLSPRIVLVIGPAAFGEAFGIELHRALSRLEALVPRGRLSPEEGPEAARFCDTNAYVGHLWKSPDHAIGMMEAPHSLTLSPTGRHVQLIRVENEEGARALLAPLARFVTTVGAQSPEHAAALGIAHARLAELGKMQSPPLDGPVDLR